MKNGLPRNTCANARLAPGKIEEDEESLKCWNLERIIEAELVGAPVPVDLTMEEYTDADTSAQVVE